LVLNVCSDGLDPRRWRRKTSATRRLVGGVEMPIGCKRPGRDHRHDHVFAGVLAERLDERLRKRAVIIGAAFSHGGFLRRLK